ncbi:unnamed protein product [Trichogramma brassicae]|uniref:C2H2-type domain-containing protein n=1 Tax=Trichogramma brassicae TaxID=86971 RepID=A0A6H5II74_9HYME|nr:unnamed protein product [Trichogramma brassicae]
MSDINGRLVNYVPFERRMKVNDLKRAVAGRFGAEFDRVRLFFNHQYLDADYNLAKRFNIKDRDVIESRVAAKRRSSRGRKIGTRKISSHPCNVCGKKYKTKSCLKIHIDAAHNEIDHPCDICKKTFTTKGNLRSHVKSVHMAKAHTCDTCVKKSIIHRPRTAAKTVSNAKVTERVDREELFKFLIRTGYKDEPEVDEDNKLLHCTTMVHHIAANRRKFYYWRSDVCELLSNVYDRLDVIYSDESGMTHFHVACMTRSTSVVARFLDSGRDPNYRVRGTDDTPLLLALKEHRMEMVEFLLRRGANPNLANAKGLTLLHAIIKDGRWLKEFFEIVDDVGLTVQIDPRDNFGRTPLQWAVAHLRPTMIDALLGRGADLSGFVFQLQDTLGKNT